MENQYIKVFGIIKSLQGQKCVHAFRILPIDQLNEITHHILEVMNASIYYIAKANGQSIDSGSSFSNPLKNSDIGGNEMGSGGNGGVELHKQVANFIKQSRSGEGMHIKDICEYFKNIPENRIKNAIDFLSTEGYVFSTIDEDHYKSTETC
jgi:replication factor A2